MMIKPVSSQASDVLFCRDDLCSLAQQFSILAELAPPVITKMADICCESLRQGGTIFFCGNGGSAADAQHLAAELVGRYKLNRAALRAVALTTDSSILTAVGNDYGFDTIFERQVEALGRAGDVLIAISTSGNSKNCLLAMEKAQALGMTCLALTGQGGGAMASKAAVCLKAPSAITNHIQEMHISSGHLLCELIERRLCS